MNTIKLTCKPDFASPSNSNCCGFATITLKGVKAELPPMYTQPFVWSKICQTNKEMGGNIANLIGKW